jgi:1,4-alpha-glucan branching enzyme
MATIKHSGLGAIPGAKGVTFRVWAPHAEKVYVTGTFNDWSKTSTPLASEKNSYWSSEVSEAKPGDEYRYTIHAPVDWKLPPLSRIDPYARKVTTSKGKGIIYNPKAFNWGRDQFKMPTGNELVIYEMHIGTFNVKEKGHPGTFDSAIERFTYLKELGINAVEVMPVAEFSAEFSWGYDPSHPFAVESVYGGPDAFKRFVKAAHEHGIAVIVDVVYNHFGPSDLDLWQFDGWSENEKGGIYFYNDRRSHTPWGETRPDYGRGEVRQYICDNALMWLEEYHADGLRWDMIVFIKSIDGNVGNPANDIPDGWSLMQWINVEIQQRFPGKISIAEGADINAKDKNGATPLILAANANNTEVAELLIAKGADINVKDKNSNTLLHWAASKGYMKVAELLIAKGANISEKNKAGKTPLQLAESNNHKEVADLLKKHGGK